MTQLGYARVSTEEQNLDLQLAALSAAGCMQIFTDHGISGTAQERPGLLALLNFAQPGDTLVVWRLDRLGRSLGHLIQLMTDLQHHGVGFQSLNEAIDTRTPTGRFMFHMIAALAEFERALIAERTRAGMSAARQRGRQIGRPRALTPDQVAVARQMVQGYSMAEVAAHFDVHAVTMRRYLQQQMERLHGYRTDWPIGVSLYLHQRCNPMVLCEAQFSKIKTLAF
ncbi:recombinase family protein [Burkholderia contaminans]|uniref:Recombinase family protein n=1 Tax=Burkholderia contaminans TaxID=488447 RepID=A0A3N8PUI8_9BURK|nr:recombinase family protein [Burkholderia contaminans]RQT14975.1 recombinase family protein [Burkholderia contaminans]